MSQISRNYLFSVGLVVLLLTLAGAFPAPAADKNAADAKFSLRLRPVYSPLLSGKAGEGQRAPDFDDLFDDGYGLHMEAVYRLFPHLSLIAGVGYEVYDGDTQEGLKFDDLEAVPMYLGCRFHVFSGHPVTAYIQARTGIMYLSSVDVSWGSLTSTYWDSSWVFMGEGGIGIDYRIGAWDFTVGVDCRYSGAPDNKLEAADAEGFWTLPIHVGVSHSF